MRGFLLAAAALGLTASAFAQTGQFDAQTRATVCARLQSDYDDAMRDMADRAQYHGGQSHDGDSKAGGGRPPYSMARVGRIRDQARNQNCALQTRSPGWERRVPPQIPPTVRGETPPGAPAYDDRGAPPPDGPPPGTPHDPG